MKLVIERAAARTLRKLPRKLAEAIVEELEAIAATPFGKHPQAKPLKGVKDGFRLRHGDWRVLYRIDRTNQRMLAVAVKPRGDAYRR